MVLAGVCDVGPARLPVERTNEKVDKEIKKMLENYDINIIVIII